MTDKKNIYITSEGYLKIETELNYLKLEKRPQITEAIKIARQAGDLAENAEYHAAREDQSALEMRIKELEYILSNATIVDDANNDNSCVTLGKTVKIVYVDDNEEEEYKIVGSLEANPDDRKISNESPIGIAIMGKKVGDIISVESPTGHYEIKITSIV